MSSIVSTGANPEPTTLPKVVYIKTVRNCDRVCPECIDSKPDRTEPAPGCCNLLRFACFAFGYLTLLMNVINTIMIVLFCIISDIEEGESDQIKSSSVNGVHIHLVNTSMLFIGFFLLINGIWMVWTTYILVELHLEPPVSIYLHMPAKIFRVLLLLANSVVIVCAINDFLVFILNICTEIGITAFFILVYYLYATKLVEIRDPENHTNERCVSSAAARYDDYFSYPSTVYKMRLVDDNESFLVKY